MSDRMLEILTAIRGGHPRRCDFCKQLYTKKRIPIPEEAGEWACNQCYAKWDDEHAKRNVR